MLLLLLLLLLFLVACRLVFAVGSHRDFALPFWHNLEGRDLGDRGYPIQGTGELCCEEHACVYLVPFWHTSKLRYLGDRGYQIQGTGNLQKSKQSLL